MCNACLCSRRTGKSPEPDTSVVASGLKAAEAIIPSRPRSRADAAGRWRAWPVSNSRAAVLDPGGWRGYDGERRHPAGVTRSNDRSRAGVFRETGMRPARSAQYRVESGRGRRPTAGCPRESLMIPGSTRPAARQLETLFRLGTLGGVTDAQLLERFLAHRGEDVEAAFAAVVERHGPMVLRVCRRILADPNDAEDAFQVTFLVLARKARSIARRALPGQLALWRRGPFGPGGPEERRPAAGTRGADARHATRPVTSRRGLGELRCVIDEELSRLPDSFRDTVVLCDLEGKTHKEAAAILGVPVGTVSSRLVRARDLLRGATGPPRSRPLGRRSAARLHPDVHAAGPGRRDLTGRCPARDGGRSPGPSRLTSPRSPKECSRPC